LCLTVILLEVFGVNLLLQVGFWVLPTNGFDDGTILLGGMWIKFGMFLLLSLFGHAFFYVLNVDNS
jgi:hypothetical protein